MKPSIFIGSSSEGLDYAKAIKASLSRAADVTVWDEGLFLLGNVALEEILAFPYRFDFAILVLTPDDLLESRGVELRSPRDNVLFELGIFMSTLGRSKTYVVTTKEVKVPSDLVGLTQAYIDTDQAEGNVDAMVKVACRKIRAAMRTADDQATFGLLPSTALAFGYFNNFLEKVCSAFRDRGTNIIVDDGQRRSPLTTTGKDIKFVVAVSEDPRRLSPEAIKELRARDPRIREVTLESTRRSFPFFTFIRKGRGDALEFFDIPTTLRMSFEIVSQALTRTGIKRKVRDVIIRREVANFQRTIERLAEDSEIPDYIEFRDLESYLAL
jgi:Predicted nucleotide-binding protein containing TIR-like domain